MTHCRMLSCGLLLSITLGCSRSVTQSVSDVGEPEATPVTVGSALRAEADPVVVLNTSLGPIKLRLKPAHAPLTVDNFLAQVENGFYHQTIFHEVTPGFVILAGGYLENLVEKKGRYSLLNESNNGLKNLRGTVAMTRPADATDSDTGQFFINIADNPALDYQGDSPEQCGYCVFGEVVEGMDIVDRIAQLPTRSTGDLGKLPVQAVLIETASKVR